MDMLYSQSQSVSASKPSSSASSLSSISAKSAAPPQQASATSVALAPYSGSTMLSPPLTASCTNPFSSFDWLSAVTSPTADSSNSVSTTNATQLAEHRAAAAAAAAAVAYNSCRFGAHPAAAAPPDFLSMFSSTCGPSSSGTTISHGFNAETTQMSSHLRQNTGSTSNHPSQRHASRGQQSNTTNGGGGNGNGNGGDSSSAISSAIVSSSSSSTSSLSLTPTSMTSSPAVPSPHKLNPIGIFNSPGYHLQAPGHGLPSPTIYPPTPPPSAPWIHPWYTGDTF